LAYGCKIAISLVDARVSAIPVCTKVNILPVADESVAEQIPCPALVLALFSGRFGAKLGTLERVRS
jgi:hypothetical protein